MKPAPIEDHSRDFYSRVKLRNHNKYSNYNNHPIYHKNGEKKIKIEAGDTLYGVANKYNVNVRELIQKNNLKAPYILVAGKYLTLPVSNYHTVQSGENLYIISRDYNMNLNELVAINNLKAPYNIYPGQKIKINATKSKTKQNYVVANNKVKKAPKPKNNFVNRILKNKNNKFSWPAKGKVISKFGPKKGGLYNDGINIKLANNTKIKAVEDGIVAYVGNELKGYGNLIIIKHSGGWISAYGHLAKTAVKRDERIKKSQIIALSGSTGNVDAPQLYFGLRKGRDAVNPEFYLK